MDDRPDQVSPIDAPRPLRIAALAVILALLAPAAAAVAASDADGCTYDQARQQRALAKLAARHRGGQLDLLDHSVRWRLPDGAAFVLSQGGCMDWATSVRLQFGRGQAPSIDAAVPQLVAMTRRYLSPAYADDLAAAWARKAFNRKVLANKAVVFEMQKDGRTGLHFPLVVELGAGGISADWQEH